MSAGFNSVRSFESHLSKVYTEPNTGCWLWPANVNPTGYGITYVGGVKTLAHRASYEHHKGAIPDGLHILHSCDVPSCINPGHLRAGTHQENMLEAKTRNRMATGSKLPHSKIPHEKRSAIWADPRPDKVVAIDYGVTHGAIAWVRSLSDTSVYKRPKRSGK